MLRVIAALIAGLLLCAQTPMLPGFPPGTFQNRAALDATGGAAYTGPGDVVASAKWYFGLRAYSSSTRGNAAVNACDSTGGVDVGCADLLTDASTGALVPATIGGITCPGTTNCTIKKWYDLTAGGQCGGSCDQIQNTIGLRAQLISNCLGTLPCARFNAAVNNFAYASAGNFSMSQPYSISAALKIPTAGGGNVVTDNSFNVQPLAFVGGASVRVYAGTVQDTAVSYNATHVLLSINNNAGTSFLVIDGTNNTLGSIGANSFGSGGAGPLTISAPVSMTADIYEVIGWGSALTTTAVTGQAVLLCHNQFAYWGTATSC